MNSSDELPLLIFKAQEALTDMGIPFNGDLTLTALQAFRARYIFEASTGYQYFLKHGLTRDDYTRFQNLERVNDDTIIPNISIDGQNLDDDYAGYYFMKVDVMDEMQAIRAACFGKLTKCCQSLSGEAGEPCVIHGLTSANGGFYVLCKGDVNHPLVTDPLIAASWAWRSQENALVFDSIESAHDTQDLPIIIAFYHTAAKILVEKYNIPRIVCGTNAGISNSIGIAKPITPLESFKDYDDYNDSENKQLILRDHERPWYLFSIDQESREQFIQWMLNIVDSNIKLSESPELCEILNLGLLTNINLFENIEHWGKPFHRMNELKELISLFKLYILYGLMADEVITAIKKNELPKKIINRKKQTPLMLLVELETGAHERLTKIINNKAQTPFMLKRKEQTKEQIKEQTKENTKIFNTLLSQGANKDAIDDEGQTPFSYAIKQNNIEFVKALIDNDNINRKYNYGETPLIIASTLGNLDVVTLLLEHEANVQSTDYYGNTALLKAAIGGHTDIIKILIKYGANPNDSDNIGSTGLIKTDHVNSAQVLIEHGATLQNKNQRGHTALISAASPSYRNMGGSRSSYRSADMVKILLEKGASPNDSTENGITALMIAAKDCNLEKTRVLLTYGADPEAVDISGKTVLMHTTNPDIIELIKKHIKEKPTQKREDMPETKGMLIFSNQTKKNETKTSEAESENQENKEKNKGALGGPKG